MVQSLSMFSAAVAAVLMYLPLVNIVPAHELVTIRRSRHYLISSHGALRVAIFLGNEFSVYCISAVFSRHESRSCIDIAYQNHVGKGDLSGGAGAARLDVYFNALVCRQFLSKTGTRRNLCTSPPESFRSFCSMA